MTDSSASVLLLTILISSVLGLLVYLWAAIALGAVFAKLGVERWKAWVPFYNVAVLLGLGGLSGWLVLLLLIPLFGGIFVFVALVTAAHRVNAVFGYGAGMTVLAALLFPVWASVLGFGAARPVHPLPARGGSIDQRDAAGFDSRYDRAFAPSDDLSARRSVPAPSAWIPPAPPAPGRETGAVPVVPAVPPVASAPAWGEPYRAPTAPTVPPIADPPPIPPTIPAVSGAPAAPPAVDPFATPAAPAFPATEPVAPSMEETVRPSAPAAPVAPAVMSWWQPAIVDESDADGDAAEDAAAVDLPDWARPVSSAPAPAAAPAAEPVPAPAPAPAVEPAPMPSAEPAAPAPEPSIDAFAPPSTPRVMRDSYLPESDAFPEASGEVSAVVGSPIAGPPRSATASVSAARSGVSDFVEDTVIASRKRPKWALTLPDGSAVEIAGDSVVLGRRPVPVHSAPGAQLVLVVDDTRTVSKTHALLRRRADAWMVSDLGSTNGVVVFEGESEIEVDPGADHEVQDRFLLGDAELRLGRTDA